MVTLKAICQICGKTTTIDTEKKPNSGWEFRKVNEVFGLEKEQGWEFWLCLDCNEEIFGENVIDEEKELDRLVSSLKSVT